MSSSLLTSHAPRAAGAVPELPILGVLVAGFVVALALLPVELDRLFGLPAHPLLLHIPVVLIPLLVLATIAVLARPAWRERYGLAWAALAVVALIGTVLAVGAGEAFLETKRDAGVLHEHKEAAETLRILMFAFTAVILAVVARDVLGRSRRALIGGHAVTAGLSVVTLALAGVTGFFVVRTGHLGARSTWGGEREGPPGGAGSRGGRPPEP